MELSRLYFEQLGENETPATEILSPKELKLPGVKMYQCQECLTIYDSRYGDEVNQIEKDIPFEQLPTAYLCPVCESPKENFQEMILEEIG